MISRSPGLGIVLLLVSLILAFIPFDGSLASKGVDAIVQSVQNAYDGTRDIRADFVQETTILGFEETTRSRGKLAIKKPGMARWDYATPSEQHVYVSKGTVLIYTPELKQALKTSLEGSLDTQTPIFLLAGAARLKEHFTITADSSSKGAHPSLVLVPKDGRGPKRIVITLDPATHLITRVRLEDPNGNISVLTFSNIRRNTGVSGRHFVFNPPEGVDIVEPFLSVPEPKTKP